MFPVSDVIPSRTTPFVTVALIVANALIFLYELRLNEPELQTLIARLGLVPAAFAWPTLVTGMFLHGGWVHLTGNMLYLWIFGDNVEGSLGHGRYLVFYLLCGAISGLGHTALNPYSIRPMIGASGAVAGIMGAYFVLYPHSRVLTAIFAIVFLDLVEIPAVFFLGIWFLLQLFSGVGSIAAQAADGTVAFWAHVTGFAAGAAGGFTWRAKARRAYSDLRFRPPSDIS